MALSSSIKKQLQHMGTINQQKAFEAMWKAAQVDLDNLRAAIVGITAQLDTDGGVTDTDYAANHDPQANTIVD